MEEHGKNCNKSAPCKQFQCFTDGDFVVLLRLYHPAKLPLPYLYVHIQGGLGGGRISLAQCTSPN